MSDVTGRANTQLCVSHERCDRTRKYSAVCYPPVSHIFVTFPSALPFAFAYPSKSYPRFCATIMARSVWYWMVISDCLPSALIGLLGLPCSLWRFNLIWRGLLFKRSCILLGAKLHLSFGSKSGLSKHILSNHTIRHAGYAVEACRYVSKNAAVSILKKPFAV